MKQKILGVIVLLIALVMVASSLVVAYVTYNQNMDATHAGLVTGANNVKNKIQEVQEDLVRKIAQMNSVFKVGENVKFISGFKTDYDLGMTETGFSDLANALFATATGNQIQAMAVYDATGELLAFAEEEAPGKRVAGFFYVNPERAFKFARLGDNDDLKATQWETSAALDGLAAPITLQNTTGDKALASLVRSGKTLAISIYVPIMVDDYNKETDKMEPRRFGFVMVSKALDKAFAASMAELTGLHVNIFSGREFSAGNLPAYTSLDTQALPAPVGDWSLKTQAAVPGTLELEGGKYIQGVIPVYNGTELAGALSLLTSNRVVMDNTLQVVYTLVIVYLCCLVLIIPLALFFSGSMVKNILTVTASLKDVAEGEGDLTKRIEIKSGDEIGELSRWFNLFVERLQVMIADISKSSQALSGAVEVTRREADAISGNSGRMSEITASVTQSTGEMSAEISSISGLMNQASDNLDIVASSTEEMTATITEIAKNAENARTMSGETGQNIDLATKQVFRLGEDAKEIEAFTEAINEISEQTNLLALNATIEAARAGEAGKGFAVVANEIKDLAIQTAGATRDIKEKISNIMASSTTTVEKMSGISKTFGDMNDMINEIASAIEEQSATTKEIADNTATVAEGISDVNGSITQFDGLTTEIAREMKEVSQASAQMSENCTHIDADTQKMEEETARLDTLVNRFVIK